SELRAAELLPVRPANLDAARAAVDGALDTVAARWAEKLWPAIDRGWRDGIDGIRADLREWLRRAADADDGWVPWRFELSFGVAGAVVDIIGRALADGFLPAMPAKGACRYCDYRPVCGPHEETRTARKPKDRCADLERLRRLP